MNFTYRNKLRLTVKIESFFRLAIKGCRRFITTELELDEYEILGRSTSNLQLSKPLDLLLIFLLRMLGCSTPENVPHRDSPVLELWFSFESAFDSSCFPSLLRNKALMRSPYFISVTLKTCCMLSGALFEVSDILPISGRWTPSNSLGCKFRED